MNLAPWQKALITTREWFYAPNGKTYNAVFGTVKNILSAKETLGIEPSRPSTNWYVEIGNMLIAGCQIHYATRCEECEFGPVESWTTNTADGSIVVRERPSAIYNADEVSA